MVEKTSNAFRMKLLEVNQKPSMVASKNHRIQELIVTKNDWRLICVFYHVLATFDHFVHDPIVVVDLKHPKQIGIQPIMG